MPIFEYINATPPACPICEVGFEVFHKSSEPELEECLECGKAVRRVVSAPSLSKSSPSLDAKNIERHGFTQYRKSGNGTYEKTAGVGPRTISKD